jgi:hypothetical protein
VSNRDWHALAERLGPQSATYHPRRYWAPPAMRPDAFPNAEIEYSDGVVIRARDLVRRVKWGERGLEPDDGPIRSYAECLR